MVAVLGGLVASPVLRGQVIVFEGSVFPEKLGWERRLAGTPGAERALVDGWLIQKVGLPDGWPGPTGDADFYRMDLADFAGRDGFFVEWRVQTDNPPELVELSAVPAVVSAAGNSAIYHTTLTDGAVQLFRTSSIPLIIAPTAAGVSHVYRVEMRARDSFSWYIDGEQVETGIPLAAYPDSTAFLIWGVRRSYVDATTAWDYVRFGQIPEDGSGDYDSDGVITLDDFYFFHECLSNRRPGINGGPGQDSGPGCRFADFNNDSSTDLSDFATFQLTFGEAP